MKKLTVLLLVVGVLSITKSFAQNASLKGSVIDTSNKVNLQHAVVSLLRPKDSVLVKFVRTDQQGQFNFGNLIPAKYILLISYPDYADYVDDIDLLAQPQKTLGTVYLNTKAHLLEEVIVKQRLSAIRMKGDTTLYRADSFYAGPNANVQDLLKRMPGIQVNAKGEITAQGQKVEKVLVDGEEFFSDDPAVVTQNLRADAVDQVQLFDKKTDQAVFTGIDDGKTVKTINLQLKEDKKKGYFGKLEAGSDFDRYRFGKGMFNAFKGKRKLAAFITNDNTRFESLNWNEKSNYGGGSDDNVQIIDGGIMVSSSSDAFSYGQGLPTSTTGGFHFSNKWNQDKHNTNTSYQYNNLNIRGRTLSTTQTILPDTTFVNSQDERFVSDRRRNRINSKYELRIDSTSTLKMTVTGSVVTNRNTNSFLGKAISEEGQIINQSDRTTTNDGEDRNLLGSLQWQKRLKKKGRTLSFNGDFSVMNKTNDGYLYAKNDFYSKSGSLVRQDNLDQFKTNKEALSTLNGKIAYTEPLWKNTFMELNYRFAFNRNDAERNTLERTAPGGKYENRVDTLSNHFIYNSNNHMGGFMVRLNEKKFNVFGGASLGSVKFNLDDVYKGTNRNIRFTNFLPTVGFTFLPQKQKRITLNYNGTTSNPSLQQIQPFIDNIDPLNITIGNPNLKQEFRHSFNASFSDFKVLKSKHVFLNASFSTITNAITNANFIDSIGRRVNQAINVNGNYNGSLWSRYGFDIIPSYNLNFGFSPSVSRFVNRVNGLENVSTNNSYGFDLGLSHWSEQKFNFSVFTTARYNYSKSSIRPNVITKYWSYITYVDINLKLPAKFYFEANGQFTIYQKTSLFANNSNIYLVNSALKKTFGKAEKLEMKISVNDLFNQNQNVQRNISSNFVSETIRQNIQRFWLFTIAYNFSKNGKPNNGF